jgi:transposase
LLTDLFGKTGRAWLQQLELPTEYRRNLDGYLRTLDFLHSEIQQVNFWLKGRLRSNRDICLLIGIPGIGLFGAALILAEIGEIGFFRDKRK